MLFTKRLVVVHEKSWRNFGGNKNISNVQILLIPYPTKFTKFHEILWIFNLLLVDLGSFGVFKRGLKPVSLIWAGARGGLFRLNLIIIVVRAKINAGAVLIVKMRPRLGWFDEKWWRSKSEITVEEIGSNSKSQFNSTKERGDPRPTQKERSEYQIYQEVSVLLHISK